MTKKIWIITDTHFFHEKLWRENHRPVNFEDRILTKLRMNVKDEDIVIHLGDICMGKDEAAHKMLTAAFGNCRRYLIKGNHDMKSDSWYYDHGWDLVVHGMMVKVNGKSVFITHRPSVMRIGDYNVHGHTHGNVHRDEEHAAFYDPAYHIEVALESRKIMYGPVLLTSLIKQN